LYDSVLNLPILCPVLNRPSSVNPGQDLTSADPCELLVLSDDYLSRHLMALGVHLVQPETSSNRTDFHRKVWQSLADNLSTLRGLPADVWFSEILFSVFNVKEKLNSKNAQRLYDALSESLKLPEFRLLKLVEQFNIECLGLVESPTNPTINLNRPPQNGSKIIPCFAPDALFEMHRPTWCDQIEQLSHACQIPITDYTSFRRAVQKQRQFFKSLGATTAIHSVSAGSVSFLTPADLDLIFARAFRHEACLEDTLQFSAQMLLESAAMSIDDNLVLQVQMQQTYPQSRDQSSPLPSVNDLLHSAGFKALIEQYGQDPRLTILLADEWSLNEEIVSMATMNPAIKIGTPRWIFTGLSTIQNHFEVSLEAIGLYKSAGLTVPHSSFLLLPFQHDIWRRSSADWLARLVCHGLLDLESAYEMIYALAYGLTKSAYRL